MGLKGMLQNVDGHGFCVKADFGKANPFPIVRGSAYDAGFPAELGVFEDSYF